MINLTSSFKVASSSQAMAAALHDEGLDFRDFELESGPMQAFSEDSFMVIGPLLRIRCISTATERVYSVGSGFTWLRPFTRDLHDGYFAGAARA